jgi:hypothetical protein
MEKLVMRLSYYLCLLCAVLAIITRCLEALSVSARLFASRPNAIGYHAFLDGVILFFMICVATACSAWVKRESQ